MFLGGLSTSVSDIRDGGSGLGVRTGTGEVPCQSGPSCLRCPLRRLRWTRFAPEELTELPLCRPPSTDALSLVPERP